MEASTKEESCDILVAGAGVAGLSFALHCADFYPQAKIVVLSKGSAEDSNSFYAQGGVAAVMDSNHDSFEDHIKDTLQAGDGLCDEAVVREIVEEGPSQMRQLMYWGLDFDANAKGLDLAREGGHSAHRVLHVKDHSGRSIVSVLLHRIEQHPNISLRYHQQADRLLIGKSGRCLGLRLRSSNGYQNLKASWTLLATGGAGQLYRYTSNPEVATGDGLALALKAGLELKKMAYIQFHPTVMINNGGRDFLLSEALRGFGAILRNDAEEDFMFKYHPSGSLATRDIVSRGIYAELASTPNRKVYLDLRHLDQEVLAHRFPTIVKELKKQGLNPELQMVPVAPAAHYFCGGIPSDVQGRTALEGLLVAGEVAYTGLHGANRLASNSLLEALVMAHKAALSLKDDMQVDPNQEELVNPEAPRHFPMVDTKLSYLQQLMFEKVGVIRDEEGLRAAQSEVDFILRQGVEREQSSLADLALENLLLVAKAVIQDSLEQDENHGVLFRSDRQSNPVL
ncbi:L-aspartate oxidase [Croceimicrobium sp.]|uniref:L-aspartate oxidase n=1 Tax=Croceimicrobium sp. TaxID=2828340 RepID=UPI003BA9A369